jgi:hypothetical protein
MAVPSFPAIGQQTQIVAALFETAIKPDINSVITN